MKAKSKVILNVKMTVGESHNVAAVLPGTDLKDEYLVLPLTGIILGSARR